MCAGRGNGQGAITSRRARDDGPRRRARRLRSSGASSEVARTCFRADGKIRRSGNRGMRRCAGTSGSEGICGKPRVKCGECPNQAFIPVGDDVLRAHLDRKGGRQRGGLHRGRLSHAPGRDRAGSSPPISTRSPGCRMSPRSATRRGQRVSQLPSNDRARAMALMRGSFSLNQWRRQKRGALERF